MTEARRYARAAMLLALPLVTVVSGAADKRLSKEDRRWLEAAAALITEQETRLFQEVDERDRDLFKALFWARRDHQPMTSQNEFQLAFEAKVAAADRSFGERGRRGCTTDMGKIFLLLGVPAEAHEAHKDERGASETTDDVPRGEPSARAEMRRLAGAVAELEGVAPDVASRSERSALGPDPFWDDAGNPGLVTWVFEPDLERGIPEGLTVQFRPRTDSGYQIIPSKETERALEQVRYSYIRNPRVSYAQDEKGRLLPPPQAQQGPDSSVSRILQSLRETQTPSLDIPFEPEFAFFRSSDGLTYIPILFDVDAGSLTWHEGSTDATVFGMAENAGGEVVLQFEEKASFARADDDRTSFEMPTQLPPGLYTLYLGIRDNLASVAGTRIVPLDVPDYTRDELTLSSVVLFTKGEKTEEANGQPGKAYLIGGYHFVPRRDTGYEGSDRLSGAFNAYGYGSDGAKSNLTVQYIFFKDGKKRGQTREVPFDSVGETVATTVFEIPLSTFNPGKYRVEIKVTDHVTESTTTKDFEFVLKEPS